MAEYLTTFSTVMATPYRGEPLITRTTIITHLGEMAIHYIGSLVGWKGKDIPGLAAMKIQSGAENRFCLLTGTYYEQNGSGECSIARGAM